MIPQPRQLLIALRDNLTGQRQAMLADDFSALSELTGSQQVLINALEQNEVRDYFKGDVCKEDVELLNYVHELLRTNELLAHQSLTFARRMLEALDGKEARDRNQPGLGLNREG